MPLLFSENQAHSWLSLSENPGYSQPLKTGYSDSEKAALCLYFLREALSGTLFVPAILSPQNETIDLLRCEPIKRILLLKTSCKPYRSIRPNGFKAFRYSWLRGPVKAASSGFYRWIQGQCLYWKISVYSGWSSEATHSGYPSRSNPESSRILLEKYFSKRTVKSSVLCLRYVAALRGFGTNLFSECKIIIDKYHFIRQITWAIENVRKRFQKSMPASLRKYYKRSHKLILSRYQSLSTENKQACDLMLLYSDELRFAHNMKEWFYDICHMRSYRKQQLEFDDWIANARDSRIPEFEKCAQTCQNWRKEILNAFKYGITNGPTEGFNNKIKVLKRSSYGIRNFNRFRTRILHCTS